MGFKVAVLLLSILAASDCKVYQRCELARELHNTYRMRGEELANFVCIAQHESTFRTNAVNKHNTDGSSDHGIFQINDRYWCSPPNQGKGCRTSCDNLKTDNIAASVRCAQTIRGAQGWTAWTVFNRDCSGGRAKAYVRGCGV